MPNLCSFTNVSLLDLAEVTNVNIFANFGFWTEMAIRTNITAIVHFCFLKGRRNNFNPIMNLGISDPWTSTDITIVTNFCMTLDYNAAFNNGITTNLNISINISCFRINHWNPFTHPMSINPVTHYLVCACKSNSVIYPHWFIKVIHLVGCYNLIFLF